MDHRIPIKKQSKKTQKEFYNSQRKVWSINPASKVVQNKRHDAKPDLNEDLSGQED